MRKITLFILLLQVVLMPLSAQIVLTHPSHAMKVGDVVELKEMIVTTVAGEAGANQLWDFSTAEVGKDCIVNYEEDNMTYPGRPEGIAFACTENGTRKPYFQITPTQRLYYGVEDALAQIKFSEPLVDLQYPFAYQDELSGSMDGTYTTMADGVTTIIQGKHSVSADAWGTVILPNGNTYDDVLRVKSVRDYSHELSGIMYDIKIIRYAYFSADSRYPIAQIHDVEYMCECGCNSKKITGYFNPSVSKRQNIQEYNTVESLPVGVKNTYTIYPNPFENEFTINYNLVSESKVKITLYDISGRKLKTLVNTTLEEGIYSLNTDLAGMKGAATILLQIQINDEIYGEKLIKKDL